MVKKVVKKKKEVSKDVCCKMKSDCNCGGALYGFGFIGALVYYISTATGFWNGALGILKAIIWPVFLVYDVLKFLGS